MAKTFFGGQSLEPEFLEELEAKQDGFESGDSNRESLFTDKYDIDKEKIAKNLGKLKKSVLSEEETLAVAKSKKARKGGAFAGL